MSIILVSLLLFLLTTTNADLEGRVAHRNEWLSLRPILVNEKREHVVIGVIVSPIRVLEHVIRRHSARRIAVAIERIVHANEEMVL